MPFFTSANTLDHFTTIRMPDITHPAIFFEAITAIQQLIERVKLVPENGELKIKLYGELGALLKLGTEPKNKDPLAESKGVQIKMVAGQDLFKTLRLALGYGAVAGARNRRYLHLDFTSF